MKNFIEELRWRGMLHDAMPGTEELLMKEMVKGYIGFDPTADSLGIGNLVQVMTLLHFQQCGHKPIALVGGATGMVGDPSGKSQERNLLSVDTLQYNIDCQRKQLEKFLNFDNGENSAEIVNNYDWFKDFNFLDFIREVGKYLTVNYMMAKDSVKNRLDKETGEGMSFTEFTYQLIQGYDFFYLWKNNGIKLQMGGSDQWGNITTGTELIRKKEGGEAFALTTPLIKKADGTKFGKTESGNVWLDAKRTSPYQFYQFWLNSSDADVENYIKIFTLLDKTTIDELIEQHKLAPHERLLQKTLAKDITIRVHSEQDYNNVLKVSEVLFGNLDATSLLGFDESMMNIISNEVPFFEIKKEDFNEQCPIIELLATFTSILKSKSEARNAIKGNSISINKIKITDEKHEVKPSDLLCGKFLFVENGKKNKIIVKVV
ncbi:MAG: tyrosine--tRNA ligase [Saprospiraceae bacterium]|nr:tyrosine--tRNA ligase [Saprospiraceae bacterium]